MIITGCQFQYIPETKIPDGQQELRVFIQNWEIILETETENCKVSQKKLNLAMELLKTNPTTFWQNDSRRGYTRASFEHNCDVNSLNHAKIVLNQAKNKLERLTKPSQDAQNQPESTQSKIGQ